MLISMEMKRVKAVKPQATNYINMFSLAPPRLR